MRTKCHAEHVCRYSEFNANSCSDVSKSEPNSVGCKSNAKMNKNKKRFNVFTL